MSLIVLLAVLLSALPANADEKAQARRRLAEKGLTEIGNVWINAAEVDLRRRLDRIDPLQKACREGQGRVGVMVAQNSKLGALLTAAKLAHAARRRELANPMVVGAQRKAAQRAMMVLSGQIKQLQTRHRGADQLGAVPIVRRNVIRWMNARTRLALTVEAVRRTTGGLPDSYQSLRADPDVVAALRVLGSDYRLGPLREYRGPGKRLQRAEKLAQGQPVPVYRESGHFRVGVLVNRRVPAVFSVRYSDGPTVIPDSLTQAIGIKIDASTPTATYRVGRRTLTVHKVTLRYLRIGEHLLRDVAAYALPPEGEDLGAMIGPIAFTGYRAAIDGERLQITLQPRREKD